MTDTFQKKSRSLTVDEGLLIKDIKEAAERLELLMGCIKSREMSLAMTNLEQSVMWAVKAVYLNYR